uniref:Folate receptor-like domain-containing protein n=1 Tax=Timema genevievae TaxID=629358 RepID=A0A7R9PMH6_TIMGE|nr:unnamed protein product [Timema genevievae]
MSSVLWCTTLLVTAVVCQRSDDPDQLLNWCLDSHSHKSRPGPEAKLFYQGNYENKEVSSVLWCATLCSPWSDRSCCTLNTTKRLHTLGDFNYDHCSHVKRLSEACKRHHIQENCFFECSPNIGPWVAWATNLTSRNERYHMVPICASDCEAWFAACSDDYTCSDNWYQNFEHTDKGVRCVAPCKTYRETFKSASLFCQQIWNYAYRYTPDNQPCLRMWFDGDRGNPNERVARLTVDALIGSSTMSMVDWTLVSASLLGSSGMNYKSKGVATRRKEVPYKKWIGVNLKVNPFTGMWPRHDSSKLYHLYTALVILLMQVHLGRTVARLTRADMKETFNLTFIVILHAVFLTKALSMLLNRKRLLRLVEELDEIYELLDKVQHSEIATRTASKARVITICFVGMGTLTCILWSLISETHEPFPDLDDVNITQEYSKLLWVLKDDQLVYRLGKTINFVNVLFECWVYSMVGFMNNCFDDTVYAVLLHVSGQLEALIIALKNVSRVVIEGGADSKRSKKSPYGSQLVLGDFAGGIHTNQRKTIHGNDLKTLDDSSRENRETLERDPTDDSSIDMKFRLSKCVEIHQAIIKFSENIQSVISPIMFLEFVLVSSVVCLQMYQGATEEQNFAHLFKVINSAIFTLTGFFLWCKFGEDVKTWSLKVSEAVYDIEWYEESETFKQDVQLIIQRAQRPLEFRGGPLYAINLETFIDTHCYTESL